MANAENRMRNEGPTMYEPRYDEQANALFFVDSHTDIREIPASGQRIFVCGSLQNPQKMAGILGREAAFAPALVDGRETPFMIPTPAAPERALPGVVWLNLTEDEKQRIAEIELAGNLRREILLISHLGKNILETASFILR
jgi:hypothetical protein